VGEIRDVFCVIHKRDSIVSIIFFIVAHTHDMTHDIKLERICTSIDKDDPRSALREISEINGGDKNAVKSTYKRHAIDAERFSTYQVPVASKKDNKDTMSQKQNTREEVIAKLDQAHRILTDQKFEDVMADVFKQEMFDRVKTEAMDVSSDGEEDNDVGVNDTKRMLQANVLDMKDVLVDDMLTASQFEYGSETVDCTSSLNLTQTREFLSQNMGENGVDCKGAMVKQDLDITNVLRALEKVSGVNLMKGGLNEVKPNKLPLRPKEYRSACDFFEGTQTHGVSLQNAPPEFAAREEHSRMNSFVERAIVDNANAKKEIKLDCVPDIKVLGVKQIEGCIYNAYDETNPMHARCMYAKSRGNNDRMHTYDTKYNSCEYFLRHGVTGMAIRFPDDAMQVANGTIAPRPCFECIWKRMSQESLYKEANNHQIAEVCLQVKPGFAMKLNVPDGFLREYGVPQTQYTGLPYFCLLYNINYVFVPPKNEWQQVHDVEKAKRLNLPTHVHCVRFKHEVCFRR
jgi:hypothetical protein